ncbi:helix-turn-helix transcriptional regulator [Streptomyces sp. NPDC046203]|uniref:helix-turn-helix domain-containing protein n=1 Tax=Streptomyces sp. NPDC046203 TaxID=3154602 RepID=UPI0033E251E2
MGANVILKRRMAELGLTQDELAHRMNRAIEALTGRPGDVSARTVRNLINGNTRRPIGRTCAALEAVFGCPVSELGFTPPRTAVQVEDPVRRRTFLVTAAGTVVASPSPRLRRLGQSDADLFQLEYAGLLQEDQRTGGARQNENRAVELAVRVQASLTDGGSSDRIRCRLYRLSSDVRCLAAFAAIDASAPERARDHLDKALALAGLARDNTAMFRVWDHLTLTSSQRENHAEAAAGADVLKRSSVARRDPLYASLAHMRLANALARLGRSAESKRSMNLAESAFGQAREGRQPSEWITFYSRAEYNALSSYAWTAMGEHERAESCLHRTLAALPSELVRDRALFTAHLSLCQAHQGEVELACATGRQAFEMLPRVSGSLRTANTLIRTRQVVEATGTKAPEAVRWIEESRQWI